MKVPKSKTMKLILRPFVRRQMEMDALTEHPIFREIDSWIKVKSGALNIASPSKKAMAEKYLTIYFAESYNCFHNMCMNYVRVADSPHIIYKTLHKIVDSTNERAIAACIPTLFVDKMNTRFFKHIDILSNTIVMANLGGSYSTEYEQVSNVLDMALLFIQMEADSIENTINHMNGELERVLKGTVYDRT